MDPKLETEIAFLVEEWRLLQLGSERYIGELKAVAEDMKIPEEEMLQFCLNVFARRIMKLQQRS